MATTSTTVTPKQTSTNVSQGVTEELRIAIGAAAAASAIFAPIGYGWKGVLAFVAAESILGGIYGSTPLSKLFGFKSF